MPDALEQQLQRLLRDVGGPGAAIEGLRRLSGGASRETWSFDLVGESRRALILQRLRPGADAGAGASGTGIPIVAEAEVLRAARRHRVPVAEVLASDDGSLLGSPGMVLQRLAGETIARKLLRDGEYAAARARLGHQAAEALAAIHAIRPAEVSGLRAGDQLQQMRSVLDLLAQPHPALELGIRWLGAHRPEAAEIGVVHGDFRLGNLLVDHEGLVAVLDWELSHLGDPIEDLGWFCVRAWRFGSPLPAGGVATREELVGAYEGASGRRVDPEALRWWEVLGTLKWGVICIMQAWGHLSGATRSVELATIGRRVCENEWDLLGLLPGGPLARPTPPVGERGPALHDRPSVSELVEAVREWVDGDVRESTEGRLSFHARVATNALRMVERELALEPGLSTAHRIRLAELGCADDAELAARIRAGELDHDLAALRASVAASVHDKLLVANPAWLDDEA